MEYGCNICGESFEDHGNDENSPCPPRCLLEVTERGKPEVIIGVVDFSLVRGFADVDDILSFYSDRSYVWSVHFYSPDKE